ncbi:MAG: hypothetical protein MZV70_75530 [Desulfobacterales bacterium]|nr:hypothetical protein [Desulfobacterales bacterium]
MVANRTYARAVQVAEEFQGIPVGFDRFARTSCRRSTSSSAPPALPGYVITPDHDRRRRSGGGQNRLLFLIDIAVPRDIDPEAGEIDNVYLFNIDDLQEVVDENLRRPACGRPRRPRASSEMRS